MCDNTINLLYLLCREVDESLNWMSEKNEILSNQDIGNDLQSVTALQRKHETLERDLDALFVKVSSLNHSFENNRKRYKKTISS